MASSDLKAYPPWMGFTFTEHIHSKLNDAIDPKNNQLPSPFVVVITGAGKGIGYSVSIAYAQAGASGIVIASRTKSDLDKLEAEIKQINSKCEVLSAVCDTTKKSEVDDLAAKTKQKFGRLDVVVANAGVISKYLPDGSLPNILEDDLDFGRVIDINLIGSALTGQAFIPLLKATPLPSPRAYIGMTSLASHSVSSVMTPAAYNTSKIAMNRLCEHISADHLEKDGVQAFAMHPGAVLTPQTQHHSTKKGDFWESLLEDDPKLVGGWCTWLTRERREWLSGRYVSVNWDVKDLEGMKDRIVNEDLLKMRMAV
jgi:NAD(P)-dependent dehydrogenase (short-subunit alcohol dehydrogenase family)